MLPSKKKKKNTLLCLWLSKSVKITKFPKKLFLIFHFKPSKFVLFLFFKFKLFWYTMHIIAFLLSVFFFFFNCNSWFCFCFFWCLWEWHFHNVFGCLVLYITHVMDWIGLGWKFLNSNRSGWVEQTLQPNLMHIHLWYVWLRW